MKLETAEHINNVVRQSVLTSHNADSCVASIFVLRDVLRIGFSVEAHPRAVTLLIFNPYVTNLINEGLTDFKKICEEAHSEKGWSVGVGFGKQEGPKKWPGHLIAITKDSEGLLLWDTSLDQASRPHKDMNLGPLVHRVPTDPYDGGFISLMLRKCMLVYQPKKASESLLEGVPDWTRSARLKQSVDRSLTLLGVL